MQQATDSRSVDTQPPCSTTVVAESRPVDDGEKQTLASPVAWARYNRFGVLGENGNGLDDGWGAGEEGPLVLDYCLSLLTVANNVRDVCKSVSVKRDPERGLRRVTAAQEGRVDSSSWTKNQMTYT